MSGPKAKRYTTDPYREFHKRLVTVATVLGWSANSLSSAGLTWALQALDPNYGRQGTPLPRSKIDILRQEIASEIRSDNELQIANGAGSQISAIAVQFDSWTPPSSGVPMVAMAITVAEAADCGWPVKLATIPWLFRSLRPSERETSVEVHQFLMQELAKLRENNILPTSVLTDNANNVKKARQLTVEAVVSHDQEAFPVVGGSIRLVLSVGCYAHINGLTAKQLTGLVRKDGVITKQGQYYEIVEICEMVHRFVHASYPSRLYRGKQVPLVGETRWTSAIGCIQALATNFGHVKTLIMEIKTHHWNNISSILREQCLQLEAKFNEACLEERILTALETLRPLKELNLYLQSDSTSLFYATQKVFTVYSELKMAPDLNSTSRKQIKKRMSQCLQGREWILKFDPRELPSSRKDARREALDAIGAIKEFDLEFPGIVDVEESLPHVMDYFMRQGKHQRTDFEVLHSMHPGEYWISFKNSCTVAKFVYLSLVSPCGTYALERLFSCAKHVWKTNMLPTTTFQNCCIRWAGLPAEAQPCKVQRRYPPRKGRTGNIGEGETEPPGDVCEGDKFVFAESDDEDDDVSVSSSDGV